MPAEVAAPLEIRSVELREGAPDTFVDVDASGPVVWTSFRDADGNLVVELPNSVPGATVSDLRPTTGLVTSVEVKSGDRKGRPVTRLTIQTRQQAEHTLAADGDHLEIKLTPVETTEAAGLSYEPLPAEEAAEPAAAPTAAAPQTEPGPSAPPSPAGPTAMRSGTPDNPVVGPAPSGVEATRLDGVQLVASGAETVFHIAGDGEFRYSYFSLDDPARFVVDLPGVIDRSSRSSLPVGGDEVERVRLAQFKPAPTPVARVVFDLRHGGEMPRIDRTSDGLTVTFGGTAPAAAGAGSASQPAASSQASMPSAAATPPPAPPGPTPPPAGTPAQAEVQPATPPAMSPQPATPPATSAQPEASPAPAMAKPASELDLFRNTKVSMEKPEEATSEAPEAGGAFKPVTVAGGETKFSGEPIDMSVRDADVVEVLRMFAHLSGLNVVIQPGVSGTVTVELKNVPWDQALEQILKINGLGYELDGNVMRIAPNRVLQQEAQARQQLAAAKALSVPLTTVIKRLSYANASEVATLLRQRGGVLSQRGSVIVDRRTNTMIIKELPDYMDTVIAVIDNLDTPEPQVMIEARIIETTKRFTRTLGINWGFQGESSAQFGNTTGLQFPNNIQSSGSVNLLTGGDNGVLNLSLGNVLNSFTLDAQLQAAEGEGLINILSAPKVATLNNERASIQSGLQIPIQTVANNTVTTQFVNATLELSVTPQVTAEGTILMDISIAKREPQFAFALPNAPTAPISTKEARTRVIVRDGGTTVIGGIYEVSTDQGEDRVPGLANIPIIGHLFKNKRRTDENNELLIFITPRVIKL